MIEIYTRKYGNNRQTDLPPGYHGSAFRDHVKLHEPTEEIGERALYPETDTDVSEEEKREECPLPDPIKPIYPGKSEGEPLTQLLGLLRGKIGTEELILILVILLTASDGIGPESLILSLALLAG